MRDLIKEFYKKLENIITLKKHHGFITSDYISHITKIPLPILEDLLLEYIKFSYTNNNKISFYRDIYTIQINRDIHPTLKNIIVRILSNVQIPLSVKTIVSTVSMIKWMPVKEKSITSVLSKNKEFTKFPSKRWGLSKWKGKNFPLMAEIIVTPYFLKNGNLRTNRDLENILKGKETFKVQFEVYKKTKEYVFKKSSGFIVGMKNFYKENKIHPGDLLIFIHKNNKLTVRLMPGVSIMKYMFDELNELEKEIDEEIHLLRLQ